MIDVLRIPVPDDGRCSAYAPDVDLVEATAKGEFINAVNIKNKDSEEGVVNTVGDKLECSVRLKQGKEDILYEIRWVVNGAPKGNMGVFSQKNNKRPTATLDTSNGIYKGDSISCQVTPLNAKGEIAKAVKSSTITINKGTARPHIKTESADAETLDEQYFLVMAIGMFIPLVSLLFKMVAPKDLKTIILLIIRMLIPRKHYARSSSQTLQMRMMIGMMNGVVRQMVIIKICMRENIPMLKLARAREAQQQIKSKRQRARARTRRDQTPLHSSAEDNRRRAPRNSATSNKKQQKRRSDGSRRGRSNTRGNKSRMR